MKHHPAASAKLVAVLWAAGFLALGGLLTGCVSPSDSKTTTIATSEGILVPTTAPTVTGNGAGTVTVQPAQVRQTIEGFGGSNAWTGLPSDATVKATVVKLLFNPTTGIGLTLIRNRIPFREDVGNSAHTGYNDDFLAKGTSGAYTSTTTSGHRTFNLNWGNWDLANTKTLYALAKAEAGTSGDQIKGFSTPWTPPNNGVDLWKIDSGSNTVGGSYGTAAEFPSIGGVLSSAHYQDYADVLADYAKGFQANMGYPLAAISIQNEPNWLPKTYESCGWSDAQFYAFLPSLISAWAAKGVSTPVMAPESYSFGESLLASTLADTTTAGAIAIVATHQYSGSAAWFTTSKGLGKRVWETEVSSGSTNDSTITDGLTWAKLVHDDLTTAEVNAFCYWWLWNTSTSPTKSALISINGTTLTANKRLYTIGQYSRFVRPGWVRLLSETAPATNVSSSVFKNPASNRYAVVLINAGTSAATVNVTFPAAPASVELFRTSATEDLVDVGSLTPAATLSVPLPASSVSTVYGDLAN
jgi:glucuronoarabinoxylan endo-1,4-beta-xylanase